MSAKDFISTLIKVWQIVKELVHSAWLHFQQKLKQTHVIMQGVYQTQEFFSTAQLQENIPKTPSPNNVNCLCEINEAIVKINLLFYTIFLDLCLGYDIKLHLMVRLQFWRSRVCGISIDWYYSLVHTDPE